MDSRAPEEGGTGLSTTPPPGEADETARNPTTDGQKEKRDGREKQHPPVPPQPKLNGGQQPPAGVPHHFDPAFRSMMPPYVSLILIFWTDHLIYYHHYLFFVFSLPWLDDWCFCVFRCSTPILKCLLALGKETSDSQCRKMGPSEFTSKPKIFGLNPSFSKK